MKSGKTKKAKKFLRTLSKVLKNGNDTGACIDQFYKNAVKKLEDCSLKKLLKENEKSNIDELKRSLNDSEETYNSIETKTKAICVPVLVCKKLPYHWFTKTGYQEIKTEEKDDPANLYTNWIHQYFRSGCNEESLLLDNLTHLRIKQKGDYSKLPWLQDIRTLCSVLSNSTSSKALQTVMTLYLRNLTTSVDECIEQAKANRLCTLEKETLQFLQFCHRKKCTIVGEMESPSYYDLMAAILSAQIDCILSNRNIEETKPKNLSRKISTMVRLLLSGSPNHIYDVVLQQNVLLNEKATPLLPFYNSVLKQSSKALEDNTAYIRYTLTARVLFKTFTSELDDSIQICRKVAAPDNFLKWVELMDSSIIEDLPVTKHFMGTQITAFILDDASNELAERFQGLLEEAIETESPDPDTSEPTDSAIGKVENIGDQVEAVDLTDLFFMDKAGDKKDMVFEDDDDDVEITDYEPPEPVDSDISEYEEIDENPDSEMETSSKQSKDEKEKGHLNQSGVVSQMNIRSGGLGFVGGLEFGGKVNQADEVIENETEIQEFTKLKDFETTKVKSSTRLGISPVRSPRKAKATPVSSPRKQPDPSTPKSPKPSTPMQTPESPRKHTPESPIRSSPEHLFDQIQSLGLASPKRVIFPPSRQVSPSKGSPEKPRKVLSPAMRELSSANVDDKQSPKRTLLASPKKGSSKKQQLLTQKDVSDRESDKDNKDESPVITRRSTRRSSISNVDDDIGVSTQTAAKTKRRSFTLDKNTDSPKIVKAKRRKTISGIEISDLSEAESIQTDQSERGTNKPKPRGVERLLQESDLLPSPKKQGKDSPKRNTRRRSSLMAPKLSEVDEEEECIGSPKREAGKSSEEQDAVAVSSPRRLSTRIRTLSQTSNRDDINKSPEKEKLFGITGKNPDESSIFPDVKTYSRLTGKSTPGASPKAKTTPLKNTPKSTVTPQTKATPKSKTPSVNDTPTKRGRKPLVSCADDTTQNEVIPDGPDEPEWMKDLDNILTPIGRRKRRDSLASDISDISCMTEVSVGGTRRRSSRLALKAAEHVG